MKKDVAVGIGGAVVLVLVLVGVALLPDDPPDSQPAFSVHWTEEVHAPSVPFQGSIAKFGSSLHNLPVLVKNVTYVEVALTWQDDDAGTGPDTFTLTITDKWGQERQNGTSDNGSLVIRIPVTEMPSHIDRIEASDRPSAVAGLTELYGTDYGSGSWTARVELTRARGTEVPVVGAEVQEDEGNSYTLALRVGHYVGHVGDAL